MDWLSRLKTAIDSNTTLTRAELIAIDQAVDKIISQNIVLDRELYQIWCLLNSIYKSQEEYSLR